MLVRYCASLQGSHIKYSSSRWPECCLLSVWELPCGCWSHWIFHTNLIQSFVSGLAGSVSQVSVHSPVPLDLSLLRGSWTAKPGTQQHFQTVSYFCLVKHPVEKRIYPASAKVVAALGTAFKQGCWECLQLSWELLLLSWERYLEASRLCLGFCVCCHVFCFGFWDRVLHDKAFPYSHVAGANCKILILLPPNARVLGVPCSTRFRRCSGLNPGPCDGRQALPS